MPTLQSRQRRHAGEYRIECERAEPCFDTHLHEWGVDVGR